MKKIVFLLLSLVTFVFANNNLVGIWKGKDYLDKEIKITLKANSVAIVKIGDSETIQGFDNGKENIGVTWKATDKHLLIIISNNNLKNNSTLRELKFLFEMHGNKMRLCANKEMNSFPNSFSEDGIEIINLKKTTANPDSNIGTVVGVKSLALEMMRNANLKFSKMIDITTSGNVRKICERGENPEQITCYKLSNNFRGVVKEISHYDFTVSKKMHGEFTKYYSGVTKNDLDNCPWLKWDEDSMSFVSNDERPLCKTKGSEFYQPEYWKIKEQGHFDHGKKCSIWKKYKKKSNKVKSKRYSECSY